MVLLSRDFFGIESGYVSRSVCTVSLSTDLYESESGYVSRAGCMVLLEKEIPMRANLDTCL